MRKVKLTVFGLMFCLLLHLTGCAAAGDTGIENRDRGRRILGNAPVRR